MCLVAVADNSFRLKLKRPQTVKKYRTMIDEMYAEVEAESIPKAKL